MPRVNNTQFYNTSIKKYRFSAKGAHWNSKESQEIRFDVFLSLLENIQEHIIVDAGCGWGDLYHYMRVKNRLPKEYIGIDVHETMVKQARKRTKQKIVHANILKEPLPMADYYICSGALNILERFETFLFIQKMFMHSKYGVLFNILKGEDSESTYNKFLPEEMKSLLASLSEDIRIVEGYIEGDFTVVIKK